MSFENVLAKRQKSGFRLFAVGRNAMRIRMVCALGCLFSNAAIAAVPVADAPREGTEKSIADCMKKARKSKDDTLRPSQGITGSVKSPGSGAGNAPGGSKDVTGSAAQAGNTVANIDVSPVMAYGPQSVGGLGVQSAAQSVAASQAVSGALTQNMSGYQGTGPSIGSLDPIQGAWNQNSIARVGNGAVWNQAIQIATAVTQLMTQRTLRIVNAQSADASVMSFNPALMTLVGAIAAGSEDNAQHSAVFTPSYSSVATRLGDLQRQAISGGGK